eukprot:TRINITY_DN1131_c0_g1_i4.p1 TRINITY_DN1131_c0_g1~~TRINITY_DN1131_c0_g1_i4.p1  ORF type:complete len:374 (+),score=48.59 TRINITY_DN1131_c0_g1_i4:40-1161(+)
MTLSRYQSYQRSGQMGLLDLPDEMLAVIFTKELRRQDLIGTMLACKRFNTIIQNTDEALHFAADEYAAATGFAIVTESNSTWIGQDGKVHLLTDVGELSYPTYRRALEVIHRARLEQLAQSVTYTHSLVVAERKTLARESAAVLFYTLLIPLMLVLTPLHMDSIITFSWAGVISPFWAFWLLTIPALYRLLLKPRRRSDMDSILFLVAMLVYLALTVLVVPFTVMLAVKLDSPSVLPWVNVFIPLNILFCAGLAFVLIASCKSGSGLKLFVVTYAIPSLSLLLTQSLVWPRLLDGLNTGFYVVNFIPMYMLWAWQIVGAGVFAVRVVKSQDQRCLFFVAVPCLALLLLLTVRDCCSVVWTRQFQLLLFWSYWK